VTKSKNNVIETARTGTEITLEDGIDLRVLIDAATSYEYIDPDGTIPVIVGAVERSGGIDRGVAAGVEMDVELQDPSGETIGTKAATTNESGYASVEFDLTDAESGGYEVSVRSDETDATASDSIDVGPYSDLPFHWTGLTPDNETTIGVFSALGGEPESGVTRTIEIEQPDGSQESIDVSFEEGGIGTFQYTPESVGEYQFNSVVSNESARIGSAELKALSPYFEVRDQYIDDDRQSVVWGAHVVDDNGPVANRDLSVEVRERDFGDDGELIATFEPTTNEFGQFTIEFEKPAGTDIDYKVDIETADGTSVFLFGDRVYFSELPTDEVDEGVDVGVSFDGYWLAPGEELDVNVSLSEDGEPLGSQTATLIFSYSYNNVPSDESEVEIGADGTATLPSKVPEDAPDGERAYVTAVVDVNGETYTDSDSASIERYDIEVDTWGLIPGETNTLNVTAADRLTGDPVAGIDITVFGNRRNVDAETFDTDYTQTDENGEGVIELAVPGDATNDIMTNDITPYRDANSSTGSLESPFSAEVDVSPAQATPGDTITVSYTTDTSESVSALAAFPSREGAAVTTVEEGSEVEVAVPEYLDGGASEDVHLLLVSQSGEVTSTNERVEIAAGTVASFTVMPKTPDVGEVATFDASSSGAATGTLSYEWDFGDGTTDNSERVEHTYETAGSYEVTLTVTDGGGETDSTTRSVTVQEAADESSVADYTNESGVVDTGGLIRAISDWRNGVIGTALLLNVINAWRSGDAVA
jgi:hypothetical protein